MTFSGVNGLGASGAGLTGAPSKTSAKGADPFYEELKNYFFEDPAKRIFDNWLEAHHISKEQYNAMSPEQKEAIQKQVADEIKRKTEEKARAQAMG